MRTQCNHLLRVMSSCLVIMATCNRPKSLTGVSVNYACYFREGTGPEELARFLWVKEQAEDASIPS